MIRKKPAQKVLLSVQALEFHIISMWVRGYGGNSHHDVRTRQLPVHIAGCHQ